MARGEQLGRQWIILQILITSTSGKSASVLAQRVNCHTRTIYRDLEALQIAGFPIYTEKKDGGNRNICHFDIYDKEWPIKEPIRLKTLHLILEID